MSRPGRARLLRNGIAVPLLAVFVGGTAIAQASPAQTDQRLRLRWFGPDGCSDGQPAARRIEELIAGSLDSLVADPLDVVAVVERSDKELRLRLSIADRTQIRERVLSAATCSELIEASALVVALAINPALFVGSDAISEVPRAATPPRSTEGNQAPRIESPPAATLPHTNNEAAVEVTTSRATVASSAPPNDSPTPVVPTHPSNGALWRFGLHTEARLRLLPGVALGEGLHAALAVDSWVFSLTAEYLTATQTATYRQREGATFQAMLVLPRICWLGVTSIVSWGPCLAVPVGYVSAKAVGVDQSTPQLHGFEATDIGFAIRYTHRHAAFANLELDASIPWRSTSYLLNGEPVYQLGAIGARIGLQAGLLFE